MGGKVSSEFWIIFFSEFKFFPQAPSSQSFKEKNFSRE
jgi:hypothetical protein